MEYVKNPGKIENRSFEIIQEIIDEIRPEYNFKNELQEKIIKRAIHTTGDFDYLDILEISDTVLDKLVDSFKNNTTIYTDTTMALSGINKRKLKELGCNCRCLVADEETFALAKEKDITRSMAAIEIASKDEGRKIFVLGNAPTAVYKVIELKQANKINFDAVIGVPVGFVGAAESKEQLSKTDIPYIISRGRKGGSNLAAAIVNAVLYSV